MKHERDAGGSDAFSSGAEGGRRDRREPLLARHELLGEPLLDAREVLGDRRREGGGRGSRREGVLWAGGRFHCEAKGDVYHGPAAFPFWGTVRMFPPTALSTDRVRDGLRAGRFPAV